MTGITDVLGLSVGHFTDARRPTGCTVVLCEGGAVCGVDVRGAAPGTRETELLDPICAVEKVHAVLLAGGSAFGLDAAAGVVRWLDERGIGLAVGPRLAGGEPVRVPIVPAAILFDLWIGDPRIRPEAEAGYAACAVASRADVVEGNVGAGAGASLGKLFGIGRAMRGGIGSASLEAGGITVAALVAVNAMGDVVDPASGAIVAGARADDGTFLDQAAALARGDWPPSLRLDGEGGAAASDRKAGATSGHDADATSGHDADAASDHDGGAASDHDADAASGHDADAASDHDGGAASDHDADAASDHDGGPTSSRDARATPSVDVRTTSTDGMATTLAVVATDAVLSKAAATKVAQMAHDGLARTIRPVHTMSDGDTVFALATGASRRRAHATIVGALAADVLATAVVRAVRAATSLAGPALPNLPAARDLNPPRS